MNYAECLASCIAMLRADKDARSEADIETYLGYPVPTLEEWAEVLKRAAEYDDINNPFACMAQYEMRLADRGFQTVLDSDVANFFTIAERVGLPREFVADAVALMFLRSGLAPPKTKSTDVF